MKRRLEVFFDYICPFCFRAHGYLKELMADYPDLEIVWRPCESHPRPEQHGLHSDLCIQGYFFAKENGVDDWNYHDRMFQAARKDRINIEDIDVLADYASDLVDAEAFRKALCDGRYRENLAKVNELAFVKSGVWAVPSYRMEGRKLDSVEGVGVSSEQLRAFLDQQD